MVTSIRMLQICVIIFRLNINLKFRVKFINEQYKIFKFNIILKIYTFHLTNVTDQFRSLSKTNFLNIYLVIKYK